MIQLLKPLLIFYLGLLTRTPRFYDLTVPIAELTLLSEAL